jgi:UDP-glucose 4-epimerase
MKILITGGAGYIGSHTCKALARAGYEPIAYDNLLEALRAGSHSKVYNLSNGQGFSVREVIGQACKITGHKIPLKIGPRRAGDAPSLVADATQIKKDNNFQH